MFNDNLALLANVAYANLSERKIYNKNNLEPVLMSVEMSLDQARKFTDNYDILAHQSNTASGYSGTIVKNKHTGEIFVLHRGTEKDSIVGKDGIQDAVLVATGLPYAQAKDAKQFVDRYIQNGTIKGDFTNVGHSLGKSLADIIHFTTDRSKGSIGFNGAGSSFRGASGFASSLSPEMDIAKLMRLEFNRILLQELARSSGNSFNPNKENVINFVSGGPSLVASSLAYTQHGKVIYLDNGTYMEHSIVPFIDSMESVNKLREKYHFSLIEGVEAYNKIQKYSRMLQNGGLVSTYDSTQTQRILDALFRAYPSGRMKVNDIEAFAQNQFLREKNATLAKIDLNKHRYWPNQPNANPNNKLDITTGPSLSSIANSDSFEASYKKRIALDKEQLNSETRPYARASSYIATDGFRVMNMNLAEKAIDTATYRSPIGFSLDKSVEINRLFGRRKKLPVDPLILDLNGDGAKVENYNEKPVLFDIDNDGGSLEETGWVNKQDGLLVRDLNQNGKIDNMSEIFSEYYAGRAGRNGESGEKRFRNGFEALKSLDSNQDNLFDSRDRDFNAVRVWQDRNHNGITDVGELQTLSSLGITSIDLSYQEMDGRLFNGNELLGKGRFTRRGQKQEVIAVNSLAN